MALSVVGGATRAVRQNLLTADSSGTQKRIVMSVMDMIFKAYSIRGTYLPEMNEGLIWKISHVRDGVLDPFTGSGVCLDGAADRCIFLDEPTSWAGS